MALKIAKLMGAGFVIGTSTNEARRARLKEFGALAAGRLPGCLDPVRRTRIEREINRRMRADLLPAVESGKLRLPIDKAYSFTDADTAFAHMRANAHFGKIVLSL